MDNCAGDETEVDLVRRVAQRDNIASMAGRRPGVVDDVQRVRLVGIDTQPVAASSAERIASKIVRRPVPFSLKQHLGCRRAVGERDLAADRDIRLQQHRQPLRRGGDLEVDTVDGMVRL